MLLNCGVGEDSWESPLDYKEIKPVHPKENQSWIFIGRTDAEAPILWPPDVKSQFIRKDYDAGKDGGQEEKGTTEYKMVWWHHWLNGHEFEQAPGDGEGQGSLACCSPWGCKESDMTERLKNNNSNYISINKQKANKTDALYFKDTQNFHILQKQKTIYLKKLKNSKPDWLRKTAKTQITKTYEWKTGHHCQLYRNEKDYKRMLWTTLCQEIRQFRWNGQFLTQMIKTDSLRNGKSE